MATRTGGFPIGFRRGWSEWQKDLPSLLAWGKAQGFDGIDLGHASAGDVQAIRSAGLQLGSVDLISMGQMLDKDAGKRKELQERNVAYIKEAAGLGARAFFTVIISDQHDLKRAERHAIAVETIAPLAQACASVGASIAVEGWPGPSPHLPAMCCTPESCRAFIKDVGPGFGLNYDPSHLIRLGVDHIRFLQEFAPHIRHVHGKDTEIDGEALYEFGRQQATFAKSHGFGEWTWRYTIPGHGQTRWTEAFKILKDAGYKGMVSVELEDENFNGTEAGEKAGLTHSLAFLRGA